MVWLKPLAFLPVIDFGVSISGISEPMINIVKNKYLVILDSDKNLTKSMAIKIPKTKCVFPCMVFYDMAI